MEVERADEPQKVIWNDKLSLGTEQPSKTYDI